MTRIARQRWWRTAIAITLVALSGLAHAHKVSTAYLNLEGDADDAQVFHGQWAISLLDLDFVLGLDADGNGKVTWGELRARGDAIAHYALSHLVIRGDGLACTLEPGMQSVTDYTDGSYDLLAFDAVCDRDVPVALSVDYRLFYEVDPSHRGIITLRDGSESASAVSAPSDPAINSASIRIELPRGPLWRRLAAPAAAGFIALFDPVASVLVLIFLVAARMRGGVAKRNGFGGPSVFVAGMVLMMLLAHSLPALASPAWRALPVICAAIAAVGVLLQMPASIRRVVAGTIGLVFGFYLAQPLRLLDLPVSSRLAWLASYAAGYVVAALIVAFIAQAVAARLSRGAKN